MDRYEEIAKSIKDICPNATEINVSMTVDKKDLPDASTVSYHMGTSDRMKFSQLKINGIHFNLIHK